MYTEIKSAPKTTVVLWNFKRRVPTVRRLHTDRHQAQWRLQRRSVQRRTAAVALCDLDTHDAPSRSSLLLWVS